MKLPYTPASLALWLDPGERYVLKDNNNKVLSVINKVNDVPIVQPTAAAQPTWSATSFNGTPGLTFSGAQYLSCNSIGPIAAGVRTPITVIQAVLQPSAGFGIPFSIGRSTTSGINAFVTLFTTIGGNGLAADYFDDAGTSASNLFTSNTVINNPLVYTTTYFNNSINLRVNGVDVGTVANTTPGQLTSDNCIIGSIVRANNVLFFPFTGVIGPTLVFVGSQGVLGAEEAVLRHCKLIA